MSILQRRPAGAPRLSRLSHEHLVSACNALYHHKQECERFGREFPPALVRAWRTIKRELERLQQEREGQGRG
jgi:hypothetical protein